MLKNAPDTWRRHPSGPVVHLSTCNVSLPALRMHVLCFWGNPFLVWLYRKPKGQAQAHRCPFWLIWLKHSGRFLVYLVVQSTSRAVYFPKRDEPCWGPNREKDVLHIHQEPAARGCAEGAERSPGGMWNMAGHWMAR